MTIPASEIQGTLWVAGTKLTGIGALLKNQNAHGSPFTDSALYGIGTTLMEVADLLDRLTKTLDGDPCICRDDND